jgi:signal peptidase I
MEATLHDKDVIFVEKLSLIGENIKRGQIIIFDSKNSKNEIYVKRVIGVEGDEIEIKEGKVYLNGSVLKEDYLSENTITKPGTFMTKNKKYKVEKGYIFVLGDNREHSTDSRELGPINLGDVKGHTIFRLYPFDKMRLFIK